MMENVKSKSITATVWSAVETVSRQLISFVIGIILARLLSPSDYGLIGMLTIFISLSNVFIECGFSNALIRKIDRTEEDCNTAFYFNIIVGVVAYFILVLVSPLVASFYDEPILKPLLWLVGINVFFNSLCIVQNALLTANLNIKIQARITVISQVSTGVIAIFLAYMGLGVWALAIQSVLSVVFRTVLLWYYSKWKPKWQYSKQSMKYLWHFGSKMLATGLISNFFYEINSIVIGKAYSKDDLGNYSRANQIARLLPDFFQQIIQKVTIPTLAQYQDNTEKLTSVYRRYINIICMLCIPCMFFLAVLSRPLVLILLTEKWASCILILQILAIGLSVNPVGSINLSLLQVLNRTDLTLKLEIIKKVLLAIIVFASAYCGLIYLIIGSAAYNFIATLMNMYVSRKLLNYTYWEQLKDIGKYMVVAIFISGIVYVLLMFIHNVYLQLLLGGCTCFILYILVLSLIRFDSYLYVVTTIKAMYNKHIG